MTAPAILETETIEPGDAPTNPSSGGRLVATDGRILPLESASLETTARGGIARAILVQRFVNRHDEALTVGYTLPLPADGAVSGFSFRIGDRRIVGEIDKKSAARERFETAIAEGKSAAILEQERSNMFSQEVGNIPAGETVVCETIVDQPLKWLDEGMWEWRFPTVVGPRYMGEAGRVADIDKVSVDVSAEPMPVRMSLALDIGDELSGSVESTSHRTMTRDDRFGTRVSFADDSGARLDRDVVVRWPVAGAEVGLTLAVARPPVDDHGRDDHGGAAYGLLTVVPPEPEAAMAPVSRDLILLIDTSGSMSGAPLEQAKRVVASLIDAMGDEDRLEMVEFSSAPRRWRPKPVLTNRGGKAEAQKWIKKLTAGGATEMRTGMLEAMKSLRPFAQRQVLLVTDGYVGFEHEIIETASNNLPEGCRLHTLGVGSAVNQSLLGPVARAGGGACAIAALDEDVERAATRLSARMDHPLVTDLAIAGDAVLGSVPHQLPDLFAGAPALINLELEPSGGTVRVTGKTATGRFDQTIEAPSIEAGEGDAAITALYGRERVEDMETLRAAGGRDELDAAIEKIGLTFQISTRLTSWVAIGDEVVTDGEARREVMPHEVVHGTSIAAFGLRPAMPMAPMGGAGMRTMTGTVSKTVMYGAAAPMYSEARPSSVLPPEVMRSAGPRKRRLALLLWIALLFGLAVAIYLLWSWLF